MRGSASSARDERDELALAAREPRAALLQVRLVAVLELRDEVVRADGLGRADDLGLGRVRPRERDVVAHGAGEEEAFLRHDAELAAQRLAGSRG